MFNSSYASVPGEDGGDGGYARAGGLLDRVKAAASTAASTAAAAASDVDLDSLRDGALTARGPTVASLSSLALSLLVWLLTWMQSGLGHGGCTEDSGLSCEWFRCYDFPLKYYTPVSFQVEKEGHWSSGEFSCPWPRFNTSARGWVAMLCAVCSALAYAGSARSVNAVRLPCAVSLVVAGPVLLVLGTLDAQTLHVANGACKHAFHHVVLDGGTIDAGGLAVHCHQSGYTFLVVLEFMLCLVAPAAGAVLAGGMG